MAFDRPELQGMVGPTMTGSRLPLMPAARG